MWQVEVGRGYHNHEATADMSGFPSARKFTDQARQVIRQMSKAGAAPKFILTTLRQQDPKINLTSKDISNAKARLRQEDLNGRTPLETQLDELQEKEVMHDYAKDDEGRITHLFFAPPSAVDRTREFPDVVLMDSTYKTNRR